MGSICLKESNDIPSADESTQKSSMAKQDKYGYYSIKKDSKTECQTASVLSTKTCSSRALPPTFDPKMHKKYYINEPSSQPDDDIGIEIHI